MQVFQPSEVHRCSSAVCQGSEHFLVETNHDFQEQNVPALGVPSSVPTDPIPPSMDDLEEQLQGSLSTIHVAVDWTHPQRDFGFHVLVGTGLTWVGGGGWLACGKFSKPLKKKGRGCHVWQSPRGVRANTVLCTVR